MSELKHDRNPDAILYSEKLLGLRSECPACGEWQKSTGRLLCREDDALRWYVDFECSGCGSHGGAWKSEWLSLIEEVVRTEGEEIKPTVFQGLMDDR